MVRNRDFAMLHAGRAAFGRNGGAPAEPDAHGNVQAARIRGKHGGMRLAGTGDGLENVSSKI